MPEAFGLFEVEGFECVVTMDAAGKSLNETVLRRSKKERDAIIGR